MLQNAKSDQFLHFNIHSSVGNWTGKSQLIIGKVKPIDYRLYNRISHNWCQIINHYSICALRGMFEMNCLFLSGDFKFQVSPKVLISCPQSTSRG